MAFEKTLDAAIMQKRLDIQEALKRPAKSKRKLRLYISNQFYPSRDNGIHVSQAYWELRIDGRILDDFSSKGHESLKHKMKFSSFLKSIFVELDKDLYGPNNHLIEWNKNSCNMDVDGFKIRRYGDKNVRCTIILVLNYLPLQHKLDVRLARLLGIHTQTRPVIIQALWRYIQKNNLQDKVEREYINCDKYLGAIFETTRLKIGKIPEALQPLLHPPDPIVIHHVTSVDPADAKKQLCYDIEIEIDDTLKTQMNSFLLSASSQQEIEDLHKEIQKMTSVISNHRKERRFFKSLADNPTNFINKWVASQCENLTQEIKEEDRHATKYFSPDISDGVMSYISEKIQERTKELQAMIAASQENLY